MPIAEILAMLSSCEMRPGATPAALADLERLAPVPLPPVYLEFLATTNGIEGFVGENYLCLYTTEEVIAFNDQQHFDSFPGLLVIGSDGGGMGYALDIRTKPMVVRTYDFCSSDSEDIHKVGADFEVFLRRLSRLDQTSRRFHLD